MNFFIGEHWTYLLIAFVLLGLVIVVWTRWSARVGLDSLVTTTFVDKNNDTLIVLAHGYRGTIKWMTDVRKAIEEARPEADILLVHYPSQAASNASPFLISEQINREIQAVYAARSAGRGEDFFYKSIILVGYSKGAVLLRKAYVYGWGRLDDLGAERGETRDPFPWVHAAQRFVLLAGMNRGWSLRPKPPDMGWVRFTLFRLGKLYAQLTGTGRLMRQCERGEPFVANLRIQWLDLMRSLPAKARPTVIQLLGDLDDVVSAGDQRDVSISRDFIWVRVSNTGHSDIADLKAARIGEERKRKIMQAFGDSASIETLRKESSIFPYDSDPSIEVVVFIVHGIRDMADWTANFEKPLQDAFEAAKPGRRDKLYCHRPSYGFFGMGPFLLWADRQKNVRWFMDEFTEIKAKCENLRAVHFIGHSNGTYVLASALEKYRCLSVDRIVLAGSVLRRDYNWTKVKGQIKTIRNYVASNDLVVGWFPNLFEAPIFSLINRDIGGAGFNGFTDVIGSAGETRYLNGGHGIALDERNLSSIVDFVIKDRRFARDDLVIKVHPLFSKLSSRFCIVIWILLAAFIFSLGWVWMWAFGSVFPAHVGTALGFASYAALAIWILTKV